MVGVLQLNPPNFTCMFCNSYDERLLIKLAAMQLAILLLSAILLQSPELLHLSWYVDLTWAYIDTQCFEL